MSTNHEEEKKQDIIVATNGTESRAIDQQSLQQWHYVRNKPALKPVIRLTEEQLAASIAQSRTEQEQRRKEEFDRFRQSQYRLPEWTLNLLHFMILACSLSLLTAICISGITFLFSLAVMPAYAAWLTGSALLLLLGTLVYPIVKIIFLFKKLQKKPDVELESLRVLAERSRWRALIQHETKRARDELKKYLGDYMINEDRLSTLLRRSTEDTTVIRKLKHAREILLDENYPEGEDKWIENFRDEFQSMLDATASASVKYHCKRTAIYTAASQKPFLDSIIVLYYSSSMIRELLEIYGCRPTWRTTSVIFLRISFGAFVAGQTDKTFDAASDRVSDLMADDTEPLNDDVISGWAGETLGGISKVAVKSIGQGMVNYFLLKRLGAACIRALQPVAPAINN